MYKVDEIDGDTIIFSNGAKLSSYHEPDCCEEHYLDMNHITLEDFEGLEFDLTKENFFNRIEGYGIELTPIKGYPVKIPGYGYNNGYYSNKLDLVLSNPVTGDREIYDITECQDESD